MLAGVTEQKRQLSFCHAFHHLLEIGSVILIVTALADRFSTAAFKVKGSGVEKDQLYFGE